MTRSQKTLEIFNQETGSSPEKSPKLWDQWRCNCVTALLWEIRRTVKSLRPQIVLTAAVGAERKQALSKFQDVEQWWKDRLLDAVVPMNYTDCQRTFRFRVEHEWKQDGMTTVEDSLFQRKHLREKINRRKLFQSESLKLTSENDLMEWSHSPEPAVIMGTSVEFGDSQLHQKQISLALQRFGHFSVFCFSNLFSTSKQGSSQTPTMLLPFLKVLADASQFVSKSRGLLHRHPFQSRDIQAHPEESFPYDQLHFYDHVPPELMFEPSKDRNINIRAEGGFRKRMFTVFTNRDPAKLRRTHRRSLRAKLQREGHNLDEVLKSTVLVKAVTRQAALKNRGNKDIHMPRMNWEAVKMSEATAWEESKPCYSENEGTKTDMHMSRVQLSSKRWVEMSMAHAKLKLVSDNLRVSRGQFNSKNGKPFGCISCSWQCPFSNISVNLVAGLGGLAKMMKCCIIKWMES